MADEKLTAKRVVTIALLTVAACVPGIFVYLAITLLLGPFFGSFSAIIGMLVIVGPLLTALAYLLTRETKKRTEKMRKPFVLAALMLAPAILSIRIFYTRLIERLKGS